MLNMKKLIWLAICYFTSISLVEAQQITVDNTETPQYLIENVLIEGPCANTSNYNSSINIEAEGIAYFEKNGSSFPFENGIILSSGNAMEAPGPASDNESSQNDGVQDADLEAATGVTNTNNAAYIEFDFVPTANEINFNYLFVSEEYNQNFECTYSDAFAFILTHVDTGAVTNLAVLPDTDSGSFTVSCTNVRPDVPAQCSAVNEAYFDYYNFDNTDATVAENAPIVYDGQTVPLTAHAEVIPGDLYHIKLVIADQGDSALDSAVFLEGGSFSLGITLSIDGIEITDGIANLCEGETAVLDGSISADGVVYQWSKDGVEMTVANGFPQDETTATLTVSTSGVYLLNASIPSGGTTCQDEESATITFFPVPTANPVDDMYLCDGDLDGSEEFALTDNDTTIYGTQTTTDYTITYHATQENADDNSSPLSSPYTNTTSPQTIYVRIENNLKTDCYSTTSFQLFANGIADIPELTPIETCDDDLDGFASTFDLTLSNTEVIGSLDPTEYGISFHISQADADSNTAPIDSPTAYTNLIATNDIVYVRLENNDNTTCYTTQSLDLIVNPLPTISPITDYEICDDDLDGFVTTFDLLTKDAEITGGAENITVSYHNTLADAETAANPIDTSVAYTNTTINTEVIFVQLLNTATNCTTTTQFNLVVNPLPTISPITDYEICDDDLDGFVTTFDFLTKDAEITGGAENITVSYHNTLADAETAANPIDTSVAYTNTTINTEVIFVQLLNTATNCTTTTQFNLVVNPLPTISPITDYEICDDDLDGFVTTFDLLTKDVEITGGAENITVSYHNTLADAETAANPIDTSVTYTNTTINTEVIFVQLLNTVTNCTTTTQFNLVVNPLPTISPITDYEICDDDLDGFVTTFDFLTKDAEITGGAENITVSYHNTLADAETAANPIDTSVAYANTVAYTEVIFVHLLNTVTNCTTTTQFNLVVNPLPVVYTATLIQCDEDGTPDGFVAYNLTEGNDEMLGGDATGYSFTYHLTAADALAGNDPQTPIPFTNTVNPQTVYVAVTNDITGCVNYTELILDVTATDISDANLEECDDDYDGFTTFTLSNANPAIIAAIGPTTGELTVGYYGTNDDAILEINQLPDNYINTTAFVQTIYVRVDNDNDCFGISTIDLTVLPLPAHNAITDLEECSHTDAADFDLNSTLTEILAGNPASDNLTVTFHESQASADAGTDPVTSPYNAVTNTQLFVRVSNDDTGCAATTMNFNLFVFPRPVIYDPLPIDLCDDEVADEIITFDITIRHDDIIGDNTAVTVSYYTDEADAIAGAGPSLITDPEAFTNTVNPQIIYIRVQDDTNGCPSFTTLTLNVISAPDTFLPDALIYCDDDNDGFGNFNLEDATSQITGGSTSPIVAVTYHETLVEAEEGIGAINTGELYPNIDDFLQTIYVRVELTTTGCYNLTQLELHVINSPILPLEEITYSLCDDYDDITDGIVLFDLTSFNADLLANIDPSTTIDDYTVSYYTALDADGNPDPAALIATPTAFLNSVVPDQTIYVSVTRNDSYACSSVREVILHVDLLPSALYTTIHVCDDEQADGFVEFNLTDYSSAIMDGATGLTINFYTDQADAIAGTGASLIPVPSQYTNTANPQAIFAHVENPNTGCSTVAIVVLHVDPNPTPLSTLDIAADLGIMTECDGDVDGSGNLEEQVALFDLTQWETQILTGDGPGVEAGVSATYYTSYDNALLETAPIATPTAFTNTSNPQTIFVRVTNDGTGITPATDGTGCYAIVSFELFVPVPNVTITGDSVLCIDEFGVPLTDTPLPVLTAVAGPPPASAYNYQWALNGTDILGETAQTITVSQPGTYTVTVAGPLDMDCLNTASHTVTVSGMPNNFAANVTTNAFADAHQIVATATATTSGITFLYSLDDGPFTTDGVFNDVSIGSHTITITDTEGCWQEIITIMIIDYPKFFTPNDDGYNDRWHIVGIEEIQISQIYIFDRYGKLIKQLNPDGQGWDGTFNGAKLPATDYWFKIIYLEGNPPVEKEFRAHFSLKR